MRTYVAGPLTSTRDWYLSAQSIHTEEPEASSYDTASDTIIEEGSGEEDQEDQPTAANPHVDNATAKTPEPSQARASAIAELRRHELLALIACFVSPAIGAWLLHHIRFQLSRPSEGLVSNYNLTIFLLASEIRPVSHLIKMVQARTLYLQRTVSVNPHAQNSSSISSETIHDISTRLADIEKHVVDNNSNGAPSNASSADLIAQTRKSVQPDLDALNRAVRRYEKRATLLTLQTESRLQELEKRMGDAITLAAAAERSSQSNRQWRGSGVGLLIEWITIVSLLPFQLGWLIISLPGRLLSSTVYQIENYFGKKIKREMKTAGKAETRTGSGSEKRRIQNRGQKKVM